MSGTETLSRFLAFARDHRTLPLAVGGLAVLTMPLVLESALLFDLTLVFVYGLLAFSAIVPIGYAGQLILSQGAFFGIGAYSFVELTGAGVPSVAAVPLSVGITAGVAYVLGWPATRASGIYLGIITLAFNELFVNLLNLFPDVTGGSTGVASPSLFPDAVTDAVPEEVLYFYLLVASYALVYLAFSRVLRSRTGWAFLSVKETPTVAESIGVNARRYRLLSFTIAGATCGLAGSLYAPFTGYFSPTVFNLHTSINVILAGMIGGITLPAGGILGAGVVVLAPKVLRSFSDVRLAIYGVLLILVLVYLPQGVGGWLRERFS